MGIFFWVLWEYDPSSYIGTLWGYSWVYLTEHFIDGMSMGTPKKSRSFDDLSIESHGFGDHFKNPPFGLRSSNDFWRSPGRC